MSRWIRNAQRMVGWKTWALGILGFLALSSLAQAERVTYMIEGQFTSSTPWSSDPLVAIGDTYVAQVTYDTEAECSSTTNPTSIPFRYGIESGHVAFVRDGETYFTGDFDTTAPMTTAYLWSGYTASPSTDDAYFVFPYDGLRASGVQVKGYMRFRVSAPLNSFVPDNFTLPSALPEDGTWTLAACSVPNQAVAGNVQSATQQPKFLAWAYEGTVTSIASNTPLYGMVQYGDTVMGTVIYSTTRPKTDNGGMTTYPAAVLIHEYVVLHGGIPVWSGSFRFGTSAINIQTTPSGSLNQLFEVVSEVVPTGLPAGTTTCETRLMFGDYSGSDMLTSTDLSSTLPENWEAAMLRVFIDGGYAMGAYLRRESLVAVDTTGCEASLTALDGCVNAYEEGVATLEEQNAKLEQAVDELTGDGWVAWDYTATVTSVATGSPLTSVIQVGDTVSGNRIMRTDLLDTDPSTTHALFNGSVVGSDTIVTRGSAVVWEASHTGPNSDISLYTSSPQRILYYDDQQGNAPYNDGNLYSVWVVFLDGSGSDIFVGENLPTEPPTNWEHAYVYIRYNMATIVTAELTPGGLAHMSLPEHIAKRQELEAELADARQLVNDFQGDGYAAWKYQATVTSVLTGFGLDGIIQVGDTIAGHRILLTEGTDTDTSTTHALYNNMVLASDTTVTHQGTTVWQATHAGKTSPISLYSAAPQRVYFYDDQTRVDNTSDSANYSVVVLFNDTTGSHMLTGESIPALPANWETAYVYIRVSGMTVVTARLEPSDLLPMSLTDHVTQREELAAQVTDLEGQVADLTGTGYLGWEFEADVTSVESGSTLANRIQIGDVISGFRILQLGLADQDATVGQALYANAVAMAETKVTRGGATVWEASHADGESRIDQYLNYYNTGRQVVGFLDTEMADATTTGARTYTVTVAMADEDGNDMLLSERMLTSPPTNWEWGQVMILIDGEPVVTAQLRQGNPVYMSQTKFTEQCQKLEDRIADLEGLTTPGFVGWKYSAKITQVAAGSSLAGVIQVGDTISGSRVMQTDVAYDSFDGNRVVYSNVVLSGETVVSRDDASVWQASHPVDGTSLVSQYLSYTLGGQAIFFYDDEATEDGSGDSATYSVVVVFRDEDGLSMVADENMLTAGPRNWEGGSVYIRQNNVTIVSATLLPQNVSDVGLAGGETYLAQLGAYAEELTSLKGQVESLDQEVASLEAYLTTLRQQLTTANQSLALKTQQVDILTAEKATLQQQLDATNVYIATKQAQIDTLTAEKAALQQQIDALSADLAAANGDIAAKQAQIDTLTAEKAALQQQLDAANADIAAKQAQIDTLTAEKAALQQQLDAANADIVAKQVQIDALTADLAAANADIAAKEAQIDTLTAEKAALQQQLDAANADIAAKQVQINTLTADLAEANATIVAKQAEIDTLTAEKAALQQQVDTLTADLAAANADIVGKQARIDALTADLAEANATIVAKRARIDALTNELDEANATIATLTQTVSDLEAANTAYNAQVTSIAGSMTALEAVLADEFNDPNFTIPGDTPEAKAANLKAAILSLNHGQRQALFRALGGDKNAK